MKIEGFRGAVLMLDEKVNEKMPEKATVLVFPGGCYTWLSQRESYPVERALRGAGFRAAVLCYDTEREVLGLTPLKQVAWGVAKTRELYQAYRRSGSSKKFYEAHRAELTLHQAARAAFQSLGRLMNIPFSV